MRASPKKSADTLSWVEWIFAVGFVGLILSTIIYACAVYWF